MVCQTDGTTHTHSAMQQPLGFVADVRRLNVALTRAKRALWVVGDVDTLRQSPAWRGFVEHCTKAGCLRS